MANILVTALNAGELSPYMDARTDVEKYRSGCRRLENMIVLPYGGVYRRAGTEYLGEAKLSDKRCRLIPFNFSTTTRFVLEFGHQYFRVWGNGVPVMNPSSPSNPLELASPYDESHLRELQYVQINDILYIAHASYAPYKLTRLADDNWTLAAVNWQYPPLVDLENAVKFTASANRGTITLTSSQNFFTASDVGTEIALNFNKALNFVELAISANGFSGVIPVSANATWDFQTTGTWDATVSILRKTQEEMDKLLATSAVAVTRSTTTATATLTAHGWTTGDTVLVTGAAPFAGAFTITVTNANQFTFAVANSGAASATVEMHNVSRMETVRSYDATGNRNIVSTGTEPLETEYVLRVTNYTSNTNARMILETRDYIEGGRVSITAVASATSATATVLEYLGRWSGSRQSVSSQQSAFCSKYGFARTVAVHEQRLAFAGTSGHPQNVWLSALDDFENFKIGTTDDAALQFTIAASEGNRINWLYSQRKLMLGTSGDEWTIGSTASDQPITPSNVQAQRQSGYGSRYMRAVLINDVLLFVQRQGRKVRELVYSFERDAWVAPDMTVLAEHVTFSDIAELSYTQQPDAILWALRGDGQLAAMTYEREQEVVAWHRHTTDGEFESVATIYGLGGNDDEVWFAVKRTVNGQTKRYIERLRPDWRAAFDAQTKADWWYLDCAKRYSGAATTTITGLSHLEGKTVSILADGAVQPSAVVSGGQITLAKAASKVLVGLHFTSLLQPMKLDYNMQDGPTRGRNKRLNRVEVSLYKSLGGQASTDGSEWLWMYPRDFSDPMDSSPPPFSGDTEVVLAGNYSEDADLYLRQTLPYPLTVRALVAKLDAFGD
jgi:hypothetical protein